MDVIERPGPSQPALGNPARLQWFDNALAGVRTTASTELAAAIRELRDDSRARLRHPDPDYPQQLADAVRELSRRYLRRTHDLTRAVATHALTGLDLAVPPLVVEWSPPPISPAPSRGRWTAEETAIAATSVIGAATLARWTTFAAALPAPLTAGVSVSLVLGVAWGLTSTRRSTAERARLQQWTAEVLNDTRSALESAFTQRLLDAQLRMRETLR